MTDHARQVIIACRVAWDECYRYMDDRLKRGLSVDKMGCDAMRDQVFPTPKDDEGQVTDREKNLLRRQGWSAAMNELGYNESAFSNRRDERFPLPKEPTSVTLSSGVTWTYSGNTIPPWSASELEQTGLGAPTSQKTGNQTWGTHGILSPADYRAIADCIERWERQ